MYRKNFTKAFIATFAVVALLLIGGAITTIQAFSVDVDHLMYQDDAQRSIDYDFSSGVVGTSVANAILLDGLTLASDGKSPVVIRPSGETGTNYLWGQAPGVPLPALNVSLNPTAGTAALTMPTGSTEGVALLYAGGTLSSSPTTGACWFYSLTLTNFQVDLTAQKAYSFSVGLARDKSSGPFNHAMVDFVWVKGFFDGTLYDAPTLIIQARIENGENDLWTSTPIVRTGLDPATTTLMFDLSVSNGNNFFAAVKINNEDIMTNLGEYTLTTQQGSFLRFPDLYPYIFMEEESASPAPRAQVQTIHFGSDGKYYAHFFVQDPLHQASAVNVTGVNNAYFGTLVWDDTSKSWHSSGPGYEIGTSPVTNPWPSFTFSFTPQSGGAAIPSQTKQVTGYVTEFASPTQPTGSINTNPVFQWTGSANASGYGVELSDSSGKRVWNAYGIPPSQTSIPYAGPALQNGTTYSYSIWMNIEQGGVWNISLSAPASFTYTGTGGTGVSLSATGQTFFSAGMGSVNVFAPDGQAWQASSNAPWIHITAGASGTGNGTVSYTVDANTGAARTGTMTIGGQTFTVTQTGVGSGFPIATTTGSEWGLSAAFDGTNYLVGIEGDASSKNNITAQLVSPSGALVGNRISIGRTGGLPLVAFDGTNYLMIWVDDAVSTGGLYGVFISKDGIAGTPFLIDNGPLSVKRDIGGIAFGGGTYLAVYYKTDATVGKDIVYGRLVSPAGEIGNEFRISTGYGNQAMKNVAFDGTNFFVVWNDHSTNNAVKGRFVSPSGTLGEEITVKASGLPNDNPLTVAFAGGNYLVAWTEEVSTAPKNWDVFGQIVTPAGAPSGGRISISTAPGEQIAPYIAFDGTNYLVSWTDLRNDANGNWACDVGEGTCADVRGQLVSVSGAPVGQELIINSDPGNQMGGFGGQPVNGKLFGLINTGFSLEITGQGSVGLAGGDVYGMFLPITPTPVDGVCGTANGQAFTSAPTPTDNLCSVGTPTTVVGSGPWTWSCEGLNGGTTASCAANITWKDDFSATPLDSAWQEMNGTGSYSLTANAGYLRYDLTGRAYSGQAVGISSSSSSWSPSLALIRPFNGDNWVLNAKADYNIKWYMTGAQYQVFTVAFGAGNNAYLSITRGTDQWYNVNILRAQLVVNGQAVAANNAMLAADDVVVSNWLKHTYFYEIRRNGRCVTLRYSADGTTYKTALSYQLPPEIEASQRVIIDANVYSTAGSYVDWDYLDFATTPVPSYGDINNDALVDLADAVLALQAVSGMPSGGIRTDYATCGVDVNCNASVDIAEALYILQHAAGLR